MDRIDNEKICLYKIGAEECQQLLMSGANILGGLAEILSGNGDGHSLSDMAKKMRTQTPTQEGVIEILYNAMDHLNGLTYNQLGRVQKGANNAIEQLSSVVCRAYGFDQLPL